ncbi:MAG: hypothetical protein HY854_25620 [Burkholderiales bacterium]|nr:hypothetical protein [Burkholderiales bacterium]
MNATGGLSQWRVRLEIALWRHGWALPAALLVALLTLVIHQVGLMRTRDALAATQAELALQRRAMAPARVALNPEDERLARLRATLDAETSGAEVIKRMAALAQDEAIQLQQADYQRQVLPSAPIVQLQVTQPVQANYVQLRNYIESVLRAMPNVSLDQVSARRDNIGQDRLEARLRWSVWMRARDGESAR